MNGKKAIKIDVTNKTVTEVEIKNYTDIYNFIGNGCELFECPVGWDNGDTLYVDEEALIKGQPKGCFMLKTKNYPVYLGNGIILGTDSEGDSITYKTNIDKIIDLIVWGDEVAAKQFKKERISSPKVIIF